MSAFEIQIEVPEGDKSFLQVFKVKSQNIEEGVLLVEKHCIAEGYEGYFLDECYELEEVVEGEPRILEVSGKGYFSAP